MNGSIGFNEKYLALKHPGQRHAPGERPGTTAADIKEDGPGTEGRSSGAADGEGGEGFASVHQFVAPPCATSYPAHTARTQWRGLMFPTCGRLVMRPGTCAVSPHAAVLRAPPSPVLLFFSCSSLFEGVAPAALRPSAPRCDLPNPRPILNSGLHLQYTPPNAHDTTNQAPKIPMFATVERTRQKRTPSNISSIKSP